MKIIIIIIKLEKRSWSRKLANNENRAPPLPTAPPTHTLQPRTHTQTPQTWWKQSLKANRSPEKQSSVSGLQVLRHLYRKDGLRTLLWKAGLWALAKGMQGRGGHQNPSRPAMGLHLEASFLGAPCPTHYTQASWLMEEEHLRQERQPQHPTRPAPASSNTPRELEWHPVRWPVSKMDLNCEQEAPAHARTVQLLQGHHWTPTLNKPPSPQPSEHLYWDALRAQWGSTTKKGNLSPIESVRSSSASRRKRKKQAHMCQIPQPQKWAEKCKSWHFTHTKLVIKTLIMLFAGKNIWKMKY